MNDEISLVFNFIKENELIQLIIPIAIPFILMHFFIRFIHLFTRSLKTEDIVENKQEKKIVFNSTIPVELKKDMVLSNENFIKFS